MYEISELFSSFTHEICIAPYLGMHGTCSIRVTRNKMRKRINAFPNGRILISLRPPHAYLLVFPPFFPPIRSRPCCTSRWICDSLFQNKNEKKRKLYVRQGKNTLKQITYRWQNIFFNVDLKCCRPEPFLHPPFNLSPVSTSNYFTHVTLCLITWLNANLCSTRERFK